MTERDTGIATVDAVPLATVLGRMEPGALLRLGGPAPDAILVRSIAIRDPGDLEHPADALLLAPGLDPADPDAEAAFVTMGAQSVAAVVVRSSTPPGNGHDLPVQVLGLDPEMSWDRAFLLLSAGLDNALAEAAGAPWGSRLEQVGDLFALADAISTTLNGSVLILDANNRVVAFSGGEQPTDEWRQGTILGRQVPPEWERRFQREGIYERMREPGAVVTFSMPDVPSFRPRRAVGVHAGGRVIGVIAAAEGEQTFDDRTDAALREAARMAALHLLRHSARQTRGAQMRDERLRQLLAGEGAHATTLQRLGIATAHPVAVLAVGSGGADSTQLDDLDALLRMRLPADVEFVSTVDGRRLYGLAVAPEATLQRLSAEPAWFTRSPLAARGFGAGISRPVQRPEDIPAAREEADRVLDAVVNGLVQAELASPEQAWTALVLAQVQEPMLGEDARRYGRAARLADHDRAHDTAYVATLATFLAHRGDSAGAAVALHVHPNTLRYRVRRACEIAGIDLDDPTERLVVELQLSALSRA